MYASKAGVARTCLRGVPTSCNYKYDSAVNKALDRERDPSAWIEHVEEQARTGGEFREVRH